MKKTLTLLMLCCYLKSNAQYGIHFEPASGWTAILEKAKAENKFIFVNCYTSWCQPCKPVASNIFPLKETGDEVNSYFISVNIQMDKSEKGADTSKTGYADAQAMMRKYGIQIFPSFLFFTPEGKLIHRATGSVNAASFIACTKDARDPSRQYYTLRDAYRRGSRDTLVLEILAGTAFQNGDHELGDSVLLELLPQIKNPFTKSRLDLIGQSIKKPEGAGFDLFLLYPEKIDQLEKPDFAETIVSGAIIRQNPLILNLFNDHSPKQDWEMIYNDLKKQYGAAYAHRIVVWIKVPYYKNERNWELYKTSLISYLKEYGDGVHTVELNNYAWDIFQYCTSPDELAFGLNCSLRTQANENQNPDYIDTFANLLYKSGKIPDAIAMEKQAIQLADPEQRKPFQETLSKMKSGQRTWQ